MTTIENLKESTGKEYIENFGIYYSNESFLEKIKEFRSLLKGNGELIFLIMLFRGLILQRTERILSQIEKALVIGALGYFIFPIDMISDFFPVIGFVDDVLVFWTAAKVLGYKKSEDTPLEELEEIENLN